MGLDALDHFDKYIYVGLDAWLPQHLALRYATIFETIFVPRRFTICGAQPRVEGYAAAATQLNATARGRAKRLNNNYEWN